MIKEIRQKDPRTGITYVYEADVVWDKSKKQSRYASRKMVGHIDEATGQVVPNRPRRPRPDTPSAVRLFAGATYLLTQIGVQIGLDEDLAEAFGADAGAAVESFAEFLITAEPAPASRFGLWARTHVHPFGQEISSQRLSELFASISQSGIERFFRARTKRAARDYWFFDTTSISSYSQLLEKVRWGHNKDGVALPQINVALVKDSGTGLPLAFKDLPGNITDVTLVKALLADFASYGAGRMKLCMDRGFYSKANIDALMSAHMKFLIGARIGLSYVGQAIEDHHDRLRSWECFDPRRHLYGTRLDYPWPSGTENTTKRSYLYLYFDPRRANQDEEAFATLIGQLYNELSTGTATAAHQTLYDKYFHKSQGGWAGTDDAFEAERENFGYFALLSNDATLDCWQALDIYRGKDQIEKAFHDIKDRLDLRTTTTHNQETWTGKLFTVFTALIITSELHQRMTSSSLDNHHTLTSLLDELETIEEYRHEHHQPRILHVTKKQQDLYTKLNINPPTS